VAGVQPATAQPTARQAVSESQGPEAHMLSMLASMLMSQPAGTAEAWLLHCLLQSKAVPVPQLFCLLQASMQACTPCDSCPGGGFELEPPPQAASARAATHARYQVLRMAISAFSASKGSEAAKARDRRESTAKLHSYGRDTVRRGDPRQAAWRQARSGLAVLASRAAAVGVDLRRGRAHRVSQRGEIVSAEGGEALRDIRLPRAERSRAPPVGLTTRRRRRNSCARSSSSSEQRPA
jgi:hypothetical protein